MVRVVFIGSGPSTLYTLCGLVDCRIPLEITIFEAGPEAGVGTPYSEKSATASMLANIASIELPPVIETLCQWLNGLDDAALKKLKIMRAEIDERRFYPRLVLGKYFASAFQNLIALAEDNGHRVVFHTQTKVVDISNAQHSVSVKFRQKSGTLQQASFDYAVIATGHDRGRGPKNKTGLVPAYPPPRIAGTAVRAIGVLGSSLSAIDVAVSLAEQGGRFSQTETPAPYIRDPGFETLSITLLSRQGLLPEADFYCPIPYEPLQFFTDAAAATLPDARLLNTAFALFKKELAANDREYFCSLKLETATADDFADRYFSHRRNVDAFIWAGGNLAEAKANYQARKSVPWRYAILRMHEVFGRIYTRFSAEDKIRFDRGLRLMFIDNYASVPHRSIERILALKDAGLLSLTKLSSDYKTEIKPQSARITTRDGTELFFDMLIDATGQRVLSVNDLAFPTLRLQMMANAQIRAKSEGDVEKLETDDDHRLSEGANHLLRSFIIAVPFLLNKNPFAQGLTSAADAGKSVSDSLKLAFDQPTQGGEGDLLQDWKEQVATTSPIYAGAGNPIILVPKL